MVKFSLFIHENSYTSELLKGISTSKNTYINKIFPYKTDDNDKLLIYSLMKAEDDDVIIILNNNLSSKFTSKQILDYLEYVNDNINYDIFYLNRYLDRKNLHSDFSNFNNIQFMKVMSPHGMDALMISKCGRLKLYNTLIKVPGHSYDFTLNSLSRTMNNYSSHPCLFNINTKDKKENYKLCINRDCIKLKPPIINKRNSSLSNSLWFIFFIVVIILFICLEIDNLERYDKSIDKWNEYYYKYYHQTKPILIQT